MVPSQRATMSNRLLKRSANDCRLAREAELFIIGLAGLPSHHRRPLSSLGVTNPPHSYGGHNVREDRFLLQFWQHL